MKQAMGWMLGVALMLAVSACGKLAEQGEQTKDVPGTGKDIVTQDDIAPIEEVSSADLREDEDLSGAPDTRETEFYPQLPDTPANPDLVPSNIHMTWQSAPDTTVTIQFRVAKRLESDPVPQAWVVPESLLDKTPEVPGADMPMRTEFVYPGTCHSYSESFLGMPGTDVFWNCAVEVTGLTPLTRYVYRVGTWTGGDDGEGSLSDVTLSLRLGFTTGRTKGSREPFTFVSCGDSRGGYVGITNNIDRLHGIGGEFWVFNGDMNDSGTQAEWDSWFAAMKPVAESTVIMTVQGNHEILADVYFAQFAHPKFQTLPEHMRGQAWSFDYGNIHFIGLNSLTEDVVVQQLDWLEEDLKAASTDPDIDWILVVFHHPAYSASTKHGSTARVQKHFLPILEKYNVDLTFSGHDHDYERTKPIRNNNVNEDGIVHLVVGAFFAPGYSNGKDWFTEVSHHGSSSNYSVLRVDGKKLDVDVFTGDGSQVLDKFSLQK